MLVQQILKSKQQNDVGAEVVTITPESAVSEAARLLSERRIGALVVSTDGKAVSGIISERDIVRELGRRGLECLDEAVGDLMTRKISHCSPEEKADQVLARMTAGRFRHMPVLQDGQMVGLISIGDVVKARLDELAMEQESLREMIMGR
ncbi:CBS domain-containing protein [Alkalilacustris brevis]|uniref:CBS domain-containing protein n=1 Tax=Alkalilacustris brevis TaxID=2026338 RepID=UPI000E0DC77A|nr:CBS domain-containing protein [Alkalilacustris brevis]